MRIENLLREHGLVNDTERDGSQGENRLAFRWWLGDLCIDILSTHDVRFGNEVRWFGFQFRIFLLLRPSRRHAHTTS